MKNKDITLARLQCLRKESGFSVERISKFCGLSPQEYLKFENGETECLTIDVIVKLSLVFDVSCDYLLGFAETKGKSILSSVEDTQDRELFRKILLLSDKEKEELRKMIEEN